MSGRWASSNRRAELPKDWDKRCQRTKERANGRCANCGTTCSTRRNGRWRGGEVDHRTNRHNHDDLQLLCTDCHKKKTQTEAAAGRASRSRTRPAEPHPGLIPPPPR